MRYSQTTGCFYPKDIDYAVLPDDIIDCSKDEYERAMNRENGATLSVVDNIIIINPPSEEFLAEEAIAKQKALIDVKGFIQDLKIKMGGIVNINRLYTAYPLLIMTLESGHFDDSIALIKDALSTNIITNDQYKIIKESAAEFHIPIVL